MKDRIKYALAAALTAAVIFLSAGCGELPEKRKKRSDRIALYLVTRYNRIYKNINLTTIL